MNLNELDELSALVDELENEPEDDTSGSFCVNCNKYSLYTREGIDNCVSCKTFFPHIDTSPEWSNYENDSGTRVDNSRCSYSNPLFSSSCSSFTAVPSKKGSKAPKSINWGTMSHEDRSMWKLTKYFDSISDLFNISHDIIRGAIHNYILLKKKRSVTNKKAIFRGKVRDGLIAACLYESFKKSESPRSHNDIAIYTSLNLPDVTSGCKLFSQLTYNVGEKKYKVVISKPKDFIRRYCARARIRNYKFGMECIEICNKLEKIGCVYENTPKSVAASVIYFLAFHRKIKGIDKREIVYRLGVSSVTISKIFNKINEHVEELLMEEVSK